MQFNVRTYHASSGEVAERIVEGTSAAAVQQALDDEGVTSLSIKPVVQKRLLRAKPAFNVLLFCEELRALLSSGMSLVEAIDTLCTKDAPEARRAVLFDIKQSLLEGKPFSGALEANAFAFPQLLVASIRASERSSRVEQALDEYIGYEKVGDELARKIVSAAVYPSLVIAFGLAVSIFMLSYVVPRFAKVYDDFSDSISAPTQVLMMVGQFLGEHVVLLLLAIAGTVILGVVLYKNGKLKLFLLKTLGRLKFVNYYLRLYQMARIYQTISMLLKGGYTLIDSILLARNLAFQAGLQHQVTSARLAIMEGKRLSTAFAESGLTDTVTQRLLTVGERSGDLCKIMDIISHSYRQEFTLFIERATKMAEPILLMTVGIFIGAIVIMMYMPIFDLAGGI